MNECLSFDDVAEVSSVANHLIKWDGYYYLMTLCEELDDHRLLIIKRLGENHIPFVRESGKIVVKVQDLDSSVVGKDIARSIGILNSIETYAINTIVRIERTIAKYKATL